MTFEGKRVATWMRGGLLGALKDQASLRVPITDEFAFTEAFERLLALLDASPLDTTRAVNQLENLLLQLHNQPAQPQAHPQPKISAHIQAIKTEPQKPWDVETLAREAGYSSAQYRRHFVSLCGQSPRPFIIQNRMQRAARLLRDPACTETLPTIAERCGYTDIFQFSKLFKKVWGTPPAQYRKRAHSLEG